jgi:hypothetical protein
MRICKIEGCGVELTSPTQRKFCSEKCVKKSIANKEALKYAKRKLEKKGEHPCAWCKEITINPKFCSRSCAAHLNNILYPKKIPKELHPCLGCGIMTNHLTYCSGKCPRTLIAIERLRVAKETGKIPSNYKMVKVMIASDRGFGCEICGTTEWLDQPVLLILDHIDGNSDNHIWSNVRTTCSNCDAQLPTYKGKNIGNGSSRSRNMKEYYYGTKSIKEQNTIE